MGGYGVDEAGAGYPPAGPTGRPAGAGAGAAGAAAGFAAGYTGGAGAQGSGELAGEPEVPGQESLGMLEEPEPPAFLAGRALDDGRPVAYQQVASPSTYRAQASARSSAPRRSGPGTRPPHRGNDRAGGMPTRRCGHEPGSGRGAGACRAW
jgi:hypothetical protein